MAATTTSYVQAIAVSNPSVRFVDLPFVDFPYENNTNPTTFDTLLVEKKVPCQRSPKRTSSPPPTRIAAFIIDFFSTTMIDVGKEHGIPTYIYFPSGATLLGLMLYLPTLDVKVPSEFKDYQGEVQVPGISPMPPLVMMSRSET